MLLLQADLDAAERQVSHLQAGVAAKHAAGEAQALEINQLRHDAQQQQAALEEVNVQTLEKHEQLTKTIAALQVQVEFDSNNNVLYMSDIWSSCKIHYLMCLLLQWNAAHTTEDQSWANLQSVTQHTEAVIKGVCMTVQDT